MSHFSVLVIGNNVESQLAPFKENLVVSRYLVHTKEQLIEKKKKEIEEYKLTTYKKFLDNPKKYKETCTNPSHIRYLQEDFPKKLIMSDEEIYQEEIKYEEPEDVGENGEIYSTCNPQGYWDWYQIGGRFSKFFVLKNSNWSTCDQATKKELDLRHIGWNEVTSKTDEDLVKEYSLFSSGQHPDQWYTPEYYVRRYKNEETYVKHTRSLCSYAVIDLNTNWHSPGKMGWFGMSSESPEEMFQWQEEYHDRFLKDLSDNTLLTIVDCHI